MRRRSLLSALSGTGVSFALVGIVLWPFFRRDPEWLFWPLFAAGAVACLCGAAMLLVTLGDLAFHRRRGASIRPARAFDIAVAFLLIGLGALQLEDVAGQRAAPASAPAAAAGGVLDDAD
jgi:uncharacterized membrane protein YeiB